MNKKGIELSINFVVILIITLVVFGGTLAIAIKVLKGADEMKKGLDKQTEERLQSMLTSGSEEVAIPFTNKDTKQGEPVVFGIGVLNTLGINAEFQINIEQGTAVNKDGEEISPGTWTFITPTNIGAVRNNDYKISSIVLIPSSNIVNGGTYVFNIRVKYRKDQYDTWHAYPVNDPLKKIRITIV